MRTVILALALISLGACTQLQGKIEMDSAGAATAATAAGHPERAACYTALGGLAGGKLQGLLSKYELVVEGRELVSGPCAPIVAGLGLHLIDKLPVTP